MQSRDNGLRNVGVGVFFGEALNEELQRINIYVIT